MPDGTQMDRDVSYCGDKASTDHNATINDKHSYDYSMPPEWATHSGCLVLLPHNSETFHVEKAQNEVMEMVKAIVQDGKEHVYLLCPDKDSYDQMAKKLKCHETEQLYTNDDSGDSTTFRIHLHICPSDDSWVRDTGPIFVWRRPADSRPPAEISPQESGELVGLDWYFNGYGEKFLPYQSDRQVASYACQHILHRPFHPIPDIILEGGSIHVDGEGTLVTTEECILHPNRNPQFTKADIEVKLKLFLGIRTIIWLPFGLDGDVDTNGHVDNVCCFVRPGQVLLAWTDDPVDDAVNYQRCRRARDILEGTVDTSGRILIVHKLYLPPPLYRTKEDLQGFQELTDEDDDLRQEGQRLAASYINFYIANKAIIVPQFGSPKSDQAAIDKLQDMFPDRKVRGIASREILIGGGNIHCVTQQIPTRTKDS